VKYETGTVVNELLPEVEIGDTQTLTTIEVIQYDYETFIDDATEPIDKDIDGLKLKPKGQ
jgi:hypothetical protein